MTSTAHATLHRLDAEQSLLGAILFDNETLERIGPIEAKHFFDPVHQRIFEAARTMVADGHVADGVTLKEFFSKDDGIKEIGGATYLMRLMEAAAPLTAQAHSYADLIVDIARRRALADLGAWISTTAELGDGDADAHDMIVEAERRLADLADEHQPFALWRPLGEVMARSIRQAQAGEALGISTGITQLDEITGGMTPASLWVLAGPPSAGKSLVGKAFAINVAKQGHGVGFVHLEMGELSIGLRAATAMAHDPADKNIHQTDGNPTYLAARRQKLSPSGWARLEDAAGEAARLPLRIDARPNQTLSQIEAGARRLQRLMARAGTPLKVLFIDHEGLIASEVRREKKWEEVSDRIVRLQWIAKKLNICVVVLVQITREGAKQDGDARPNMSHLANSADIERCADVIALLYREAYFAQRIPAHKRSDEELFRCDSQALEFILDKSRDGVRKTVKATLDVRTGYLAEDPHA